MKIPKKTMLAVIVMLGFAPDIAAQTNWTVILSVVTGLITVYVGWRVAGRRWASRD